MRVALGHRAMTHRPATGLPVRRRNTDLAQPTLIGLPDLVSDHRDVVPKGTQHWGVRRFVQYKTWLELGINAEVLQKAGIERP